MVQAEIRALLEDEVEPEGLELTLLAGARGLGNKVDSNRIQKPGLALAGFASSIHLHRVQVLGATEIGYLEGLSPDERGASIRHFLETGPTGIVLTKDLRPPSALVDSCERYAIPLLGSPLATHLLIERLTRRLEILLAPRTRVHGVLVDVHEIGVLLLGRTGIGKSECALDLILRGHKLVADDSVEIHKRGPKTLVGQGIEVIRHHMEIRGLGIINIRDLFGIAAVRDAKKIELVIELVAWEDGREYDRLGLDERTTLLLDTEVSALTMPISPGRNVSTLIEVAARNQALKAMGHHSAKAFQDMILRRNLGQ
ncbi:MAG: HPr(Ser) kinase/phosphatase [Myxococcales bacterium]|nr:HPr(Ser) kinase/phosphatase [Myxococcales bacterium]